jgi:transcriptional regulator with XRE-family HTH domain
MFGDRLKDLRLKKKMSQDELAKEMGLSRTTITMWETNQRKPDLDSAKALAQIFGVTTDYLLGNVEKPDRIAVAEPEIGEGWIAVVDEAKSSGLSPEDFKAFIDAVKRKKPG